MLCCGTLPSRTPASISGLLPVAFTFFMAAGGNQPPSLKPAQVKVEGGIPGRRRGRARSSNISWVHISGLTGETVQIPGVHQTGCRMGHLGQHLPDVAKPEIEADAAIGKEQAMAAGDRSGHWSMRGWLKGGKLGARQPRAFAQIGLGKEVFSTLM